MQVWNSTIMLSCKWYKWRVISRLKLHKWMNFHRVYVRKKQGRTSEAWIKLAWQITDSLWASKKCNLAFNFLFYFTHWRNNYIRSLGGSFLGTKSKNIDWKPLLWGIQRPNESDQKKWEGCLETQGAWKSGIDGIDLSWSPSFVKWVSLLFGSFLAYIP